MKTKVSNLPVLIDDNVYSRICNGVWNNLVSRFEKYTQASRVLDVYHKVYLKDLVRCQRSHAYSYEF